MAGLLEFDDPGGCVDQGERVGEFGGRRERVGGAVHDEGGDADVGQMLGAQPLGFARRMQGIGREHQTVGQRRILGDGHRRLSAAVGVATDDERPVGLAAERRDGRDDPGPIGSRRRRTRRPLGASSSIRQIDPCDDEPAPAQFVGIGAQDRRGPVTAGTVGEHDDATRCALGPVDIGSDVVVLVGLHGHGPYRRTSCADRRRHPLTDS